MEKDTIESNPLTLQPTIIGRDVLLSHWMGHRALSRKVIETFPDDKLFSFSLGGMRSFGELAMEMIRMGAPGIRGVVTGTWPSWSEVEKSYPTPQTRDELLALWDRATEQIKSLWPHIPPQRFHEVDKVFGQYEGPIYWSILYFIDNEIHHRGQGYVYLRALGITPPGFWERD